MPSSLIGALRVTLGADTAEFERGLSQAERRAATAGNSISASLGKIKSAAAGLASGLIAGLSVAAFTQAARGAFDYADAIADLADRTGATTRVIQEFRFAAQLSGSSVEVADEALGKFARTLGLAQAGSAAQAKLFQQLGVTSADFEKAFQQTLDGLAKLPTVQERNAKALQIFGKSAATLTGLLGEGSAGFNELAQRANDLGIVLSDDLVRGAGKVNDQLDTMKMIVDARMSKAIVDNADSIIALADAMATLIDKAAGAVEGLRNFGSNIRQLRNASEGWTFGVPNSGESGRRGRLNYFAESLARDFPDGGRNKPKPRPVRAGGGMAGTLPTPSGEKKKGKSAEQLAAEAERKRKDAIRDAYQADEDVRRGQMDELRARQDLVSDIKDRSVLAEQMLDLERKGEEAQVAYNLAMGDITKDQADKQLAQIATIAGLRLEKQKQDERYEIERDMIERQRAIADSALEVREMEASLAETASERRAIELRIVEARFAQLRQIEQDILDDDRASQEQKDAAGRRLIDLDKLQVGATEQTIRGTRGPLEDYLSSLPNTAAKANEALENVAAGGVSSLIDGLADAATGVRSLGDVFKNISQQIVADLIRIQLQKALVGALGNSLGGLLGLGGGSGIQWKGTAGLDTSGLPALASGGVISVMGNRGVDTNLLSINGMPAAMVNRGERISVAKNGSEQVPALIQIVGDEGAAFVPRVAGISGNVSVEAVRGSNAAAARRGRQRLA